MWFESTFVFTMLEPWEKVLCGEFVGRETDESKLGFERFNFRSIGDHDSILARWHGSRPLFPPAREDDVR